jgi:hypothetical protein
MDDDELLITSVLSNNDGIVTFDMRFDGENIQEIDDLDVEAVIIKFDENACCNSGVQQKYVLDKKFTSRGKSYSKRFKYPKCTSCDNVSQYCFYGELPTKCQKCAQPGMIEYKNRHRYCVECGVKNGSFRLENKVYCSTCKPKNAVATWIKYYKKYRALKLQKRRSLLGLPIRF